MTPLALMALAAATFLLPSAAVARRRLKAMTARPARDGQPAERTHRRSGRVVPAVAALSAGCLPLALIGLPAGAVVGPLVGAVIFPVARRLVTNRSRRRSRGDDDPLALASSWDLLAACLRGGLSVPEAVRAIAGQISGEAAVALRHTADLIALGADPVDAWEPALRHPSTAELARGARRTARSGAALADTAEGLARTVRSTAGDLAEARAQRAAVAVTGPLGLCFLPAFLCLGVVPVVIGLAVRLIASW